MRKQCVPGSFLSAHALEPGNEAKYYPYYISELKTVYKVTVYYPYYISKLKTVYKVTVYYPYYISKLKTVYKVTV